MSFMHASHVIGTAKVVSNVGIVILNVVAEFRMAHKNAVVQSSGLQLLC